MGPGVTATLAPAEGSDASFAFTDHADIDLVQERQAPMADVYLNWSSFGESLVASQAAEPDGTKRFRNALVVTVQNRTARPAAIPWPATMIEELKSVLAPRVPAAGLFDDAPHAPQPVVWQPAVDTEITGVGVKRASGPVPEDPTLPANLPQRFTYLYDVVFDPGHQAFAGLAVGASRNGRLRVTAVDRSGNSTAQEVSMKFFRDANPYMVDGDPAWLSRVTRVLRIFEGETVFGVTIVADQPHDFIRNLLLALNDTGTPAAIRDAWFQSLPTFAGQDVLEFSTDVRTPATGQRRKIYNFALARIRLQGMVGAVGVRAFFRLFTYAGSNLIFDGVDATATAGNYRTHTDGTRKVPLLGFLSGGEVISIPFFAIPRVASSVDMKTQPVDMPNVSNFPAGIATEQIRYFGAYLDINQDAARLPAQRVSDASRRDGGFLASEVQPIRATILDAHQCMVVEIQYDGDQTSPGTTPLHSDNLAQRNVAILRSDNPGSEVTRTVEHSFAADVRRRCCDEHEHPVTPGMVTFLGTRREAVMAERAARASRDFHAIHIHRDPDQPDEVVKPSDPVDEPPHDHVREEDTHPHEPLEPAEEARERNGHHHEDDSHDQEHQAEHDHGQTFTLAFDDADWKPVGHVTDELMFLWSGLPEETDVELYLPGVRAEEVMNLRNVRHAPGNVCIRDEHTVQLVPGGITYVPLPPTGEGRVVGVVTARLPEGIRHGQSWQVDVLQVRGSEHTALGAFRMDIRVDRDREDMALAERRLLEVLFERRSLRRAADPWLPVLARRVVTTRSRARALAERAGLDWVDPTQWIDQDGKSHDLEGPRVRVVLEAIEIRRDYDPWIKGAGEISFTTRVETPANGGIVTQVRVPDSGVLRLSDGQKIELEQAIFFRPRKRRATRGDRGP